MSKAIILGQVHKTTNTPATSTTRWEKKNRIVYEVYVRPQKKKHKTLPCYFPTTPSMSDETKDKFQLKSLDTDSVVVVFHSEINKSSEIPGFIRFMEDVVLRAENHPGCPKNFIFDARALEKYSPMVGLKLTSAIKQTSLLKDIHGVACQCVCIMGSRKTAIPAKVFAKLFNKMWAGSDLIQVLCATSHSDVEAIGQIDRKYGLS